MMASQSTLDKLVYCQIILLHGHEILWFGDDRHVHGRFNSWIFKLYSQLLNLIIFSLGYEIRESSCPRNTRN